MRILLISPPFDRFKKIESIFFPVGLGYITAILNENGYYTRIYNADIGLETKRFKLFSERNRVLSFENFVKSLNDKNHYVWKEIVKVISEFKPDLIGINANSDTYPSTIRLANLLRENGITAKIFVGGPHATLAFEEIISEKNIDFVIRGEGEFTTLELVKTLEKETDLKNVLGLSYKKNGKIIHNRDRPLIENLDSLPLPARNLVLFPELYPPKAMNIILASRGCPYNCSYCASAKIWNRKFRARSTSSIISEIKQIVEKYDVKNFRFWDDTFTSIKGKVVELCKAIIKEDLHKKVTWNCLTRVNVVDEELLSWLKKSNCTMIAIGIESGSQKILDLTNKGITLEQIKNAVKLIKKHNFLLHTYWMLGLPEEKEEDILASIKLLRELKPDSAMVNVLVPYPGTLEFEKVVKLGMIPKDYNWKEPLYPYKGYTKIEQERFNKLFELFVKEAEKTENKMIPTLRKAWIYRKVLLQNPLRIFKEIQKRFVKRSVA